MIRRTLLAALAVLAALALAPARPAAAADSTATLLAAADGWNGSALPRLGLRIALAPGWHTYWSNPGDAGLAPAVTVSLDGAPPVASRLDFPTPARIPADGLMSYGYEGEVLLAFAPPAAALARAAPSRPLAVAVHADWLVCATVCVPRSADLSLVLPYARAPSPSAAAPLFARAAAAMPRAVPLDATLSPAGVLRVRGAGIAPGALRDAWFIPDAPGVIDQLAPQAASFAPDALLLHLRPAGARLPDRLAGLVVLARAGGGEVAVRIEAERGPAAPAPAAGRGPLALLALALLGGLVLNLMPCVFPVLAMKAIAILRHGPDQRRALRRSALLYAAGVVASFVAVGVALIALRAAGGVAGWGFQFRAPLFVALTGWLLFAVGLNLIGALEIGGRFAGFGQKAASRGGALGDLATGALAVVVATPCTAPFMSVAVAGAMAAGTAEAVAIFAFLGIGLASPSLAIALVPGAARLLPRPGAWMARLRELLAFPMFGAAAWLAWVLAVETGPRGALVFGAGAVLIGLAAWLRALPVPQARPGLRRSLAALSLASLLVALSLPVDLAPQAAPAPADGVERFDPARLASLRAAGRPVFVDMGAAWCVSCLVNERVALDAGAVRARFSRDGIVRMRGDWTGQDRVVTAFLRGFGREGVPLYVFYPPDGAAPRVLPQILTEATVLDALGTPSGTPSGTPAG